MWPVIFVSDRFKGTLTLVLEREGEQWLIIATESEPELSREFTDPRVSLPLHPVRVTVRDAETREPISTKTNAARSRSLTLDARLTATGSSWISARAYASELLPYQAFEIEGLKGIPVVAHTSPIYLAVSGRQARSREDAAFLLSWCDSALDWAKTVARLDPSQRAEVVALYESARSVYLTQMEESR